jgi:hypothetical protein
MPPTRIVPVRSSVKSFEEVRLALQRLSADIDRLSGSNPFSVTIGQAAASETGGGGIAGSTRGQLLATNLSSDWSALQPGADNTMLRYNSAETLGLEARTPAEVLDDIGAAASGHIHPFFHGTFLESFDALVTSDGATVTMSIEQAGTGDLTMLFSDGATTLDCTPAATIALTAGSLSSPTGNFIYVLQSTKALTKSTSDWPADSIEHIKVGQFLVPSAAVVQARGVYVNHNLNDHAQGTGNQGHLSHITDRLRSQHAIYKSGVALTMTVGGGTTVDAAVTSGIVYQMHQHATPALNTATGDEILIINQNGAAYDPVTDLETLTNDSAGVAVKKYFNWVIWGIANKGGEYSPLALNLPTGSYNQQASAEADVSAYDVLTIPSEFNIDSQTGFLIARITMSKVGGTWAHVSTVDLRGATPQTVVGGVGGVDTEFSDNAFKLFNVTDNTKVLDFQLSGLTTATTRTITMADADVDLGEMVSAAAALTANALVIGDGARGLTATTIAVDGSQNITNVGSFAIQNGGSGMKDHNGRIILKPGVIASAANYNYMTLWNADQAGAPRFVVVGGGSNIGTDFYDSGPNELLKLASVASAVNEVTITNAATTNDPSITASGGDANIGITIASKGTEAVRIPGRGTGGYTEYDLRVGDVTTPDYGMIQIGNMAIGRTSHNVGAIDLDGTILIRNIGGPVTSEIELIIVESGGTDCRLAIPKSAVGNATYHPRSMLLAGPAPADTDFVKVSYWQGQGLFDNLACDTAGSGADLGVQNDLEVEGNIYVDSILESTTAAGVAMTTSGAGVVTVNGDQVGLLGEYHIPMMGAEVVSF